jgi:hypothetical protein
MHKQSQFYFYPPPTHPKSAQQGLLKFSPLSRNKARKAGGLFVYGQMYKKGQFYFYQPTHPP